MLDKIVEKTKSELQVRKSKIPADLFDLEGKTRNFSAALAKGDGRALITEIKPASPSQGHIRNVDVADVVSQMQKGGANAISVLTEPFYFSGSLENLRLAKQATDLPVMRKDFIVDFYQLLEAKHYGADAVLLMVSVLEDQTKDFYEKTKDLGMQALVEVHNKDELDIALSCDAQIVGLNNRNLTDLSVDLKTTEILSKQVPKNKIKVSESGIKNKEDLDYVLQFADAALIGTSIMKSDNIPEAIRNLK